MAVAPRHGSLIGGVPPPQFRQLGEVRRHVAGLVHSGPGFNDYGAGRRGGVADAPNL